MSRSILSIYVWSLYPRYREESLSLPSLSRRESRLCRLYISKLGVSLGPRYKGTSLATRCVENGVSLNLSRRESLCSLERRSLWILSIKTGSLDPLRNRIVIVSLYHVYREGVSRCSLPRIESPSSMYTGGVSICYRSRRESPDYIDNG